MTPEEETKSMGIDVEDRDKRVTLKPLVIVAHEVHESGGMERVIAQMIRRAVETRPVTVISIGLSNSLRPGVTWHRIRAPRRPAIVTFLMFYIIAGIRLRSVGDAIVHIQGPIVPNRADIATIHFCHAAFRKGSALRPRASGRGLRDLNRQAFQMLAAAAERWSYRTSRVGTLACVSEGVAAEVQAYFPDMPRAVVPNGVSTLEFHYDEGARVALRSDADIADQTVVALFVGGDWERKGLATVLDGLTKLEPEILAAIQLWVVGRGDVRTYASRVHHLGLARAVRFFGERRRVAPFYAAADLFVVPSYYETFGLAAYEAAACGLPLLVNASHGIREILLEGVTGFDVAGSPQTLALRMSELVANPKRRKQMGLAAEQLVRRHSWERSWDTLNALYASFDQP